MSRFFSIFLQIPGFPFAIGVGGQAGNSALPTCAATIYAGIIDGMTEKHDPADKRSCYEGSGEIYFLQNFVRSLKRAEAY
jgi:hypothetical protein